MNWEGGRALFRALAFVANNFTIYCVVDVKTDTPICARSSVTASGAHLDSRKKPMMHCRALKSLLELLLMMTAMTTCFHASSKSHVIYAI